MSKVEIARVTGREILDSRGNPTVEATVALSDGTLGVASVPSGASTGIYEAYEKRDKDRGRFQGMGVLEAVSNINREIAPALCGMNPALQREIDRTLIELDGSDNKSNLGANAILAVSLATVRAAANSQRLPLFRYLGGIRCRRMPIPMMNILNGGKHASNNLDIQEFMIVPHKAVDFQDAIRIGSEIYHTLGKILKSEGYSTGVGDEGGYAPDLEQDEDALTLLCRAIESAGYTRDQVGIALDCAASEWYDDGMYQRPKRGDRLTPSDLISWYASLADRYPIVSLEDGLDQRDFDNWAVLTHAIGSRMMLVGDDLFVTNAARLKQGIATGAANAVLIKPNQVGTLSEVIDFVDLAQSSGYACVMSHRSGETEDTTIADLAVALQAGFIKAGAPCRSERTAKYNRLLRIENVLGNSAVYNRLNLSASQTNFEDFPLAGLHRGNEIFN